MLPSPRTLGTLALCGTMLGAMLLGLALAAAVNSCTAPTHVVSLPHRGAIEGEWKP
jgi:hypothetical protein